MDTILEETRFRMVPRTRVFTDASGNFLFTNPPTGPQVLLINGPSALYPGDLPVQTTIQAGQANVLPYPVFLHEVGQNYFTIVQGGQTIVAPSDIPGFSMMIPAGTTITGWDGQPNLKVSVVPVPIDRLPIPTLPPNVPAKQVYMFNFGKPGGGYPSRPIPIIMPNDYGAAPGTRMDMWYYDEGPTPDPNSHQWKVYGQGTVSADGTSVIPDPGVGQPKFCCGGGSPHILWSVVRGRSCDAPDRYVHPGSDGYGVAGPDSSRHSPGLSLTRPWQPHVGTPARA